MGDLDNVTWARTGTTRVMQTTFGGGDDPDPANRGDCFPACIASLLGLASSEGVPRWYGSDTLGDQEANWWAIVEWLHARGLTIMAWEWPLSPFMVRSIAGATVVVTGVSPRFREGLHAVLGQVQADGTLKLVHDPHPSGDFVVGEPSMIEVVFPLTWPPLDDTCGTCGEAIKPEPITGTTCACASRAEGTDR